VSTRSAGGIVSFAIDRKGILEGPPLNPETGGSGRAPVRSASPRAYNQAPSCGPRVTLIPRLIPESCFHVPSAHDELLPHPVMNRSAPSCCNSLGRRRFPTSASPRTIRGFEPESGLLVRSRLVPLVAVSELTHYPSRSST
jgi:hypothetical protein